MSVGICVDARLESIGIGGLLFAIELFEIEPFVIEGCFGRLVGNAVGNLEGRAMGIKGRLRSLAVLVSLLFAGSATADERVLDPCVWESGSCDWSLRMEPSDERGVEHAAYRLVLNGTELWAREFPFAMREAVVTEWGQTIGYAYPDGYYGTEIVVLLIRPDGEMLVLERHAREGFDVFIRPGKPPEPGIGGVLLSETGGYAAIRAHQSRDKAKPTTWWLYDAISGARMGSWSPPRPSLKQYDLAREIHAAAIPGTNLCAIHWYVLRSRKACFEIVDPKAKTSVWSRCIENEYPGFGEGWSWWDLERDGVEQLRADDHRITVSSYSECAEVSYDVVRGSDGQWIVAESDRRPGAPRSERDALVRWDPVPIELEEIGGVELIVPERESPIGSVSNISIDDAGRIGWVRSPETDDEDRRSIFVLVDDAGDEVAQHRLDLPACEQGTVPEAVWLSGDRWVISLTCYEGRAAHPGAWFIDARSGDLREVGGLPSGRVRRVSRTSDGGFAVFSGYSGSGCLAVFGPDGEPQEAPKSMTRGFVTDLCALDDGGFAFIESSKRVVIWRDGEVSRVDVKELLNKDFVYAAGLRRDVNGGILLLETSGGQTIARLGPDGTLRGTVQVEGPSGEQFNVYNAWCVDPDGFVWASDKHRLYRYDGEGRVDRLLGATQNDELVSPRGIDVDSAGRVYAIDASTGYGHMFDRNGVRMRVLKPDPDEERPLDWPYWIYVGLDGSARFVGGGGSSVLFDAEGGYVRREAREEISFDLTHRWRPVGGGWESNLQTLRRVNDEGETEILIERRPSGEWLRSMTDFAVSERGEIATVSYEIGPGAPGPSLDHRLCVFAADGEPIMELPLPDAKVGMSGLRFDGDRVLLISRFRAEVYVIPLNGNPVRVWRMPGFEDHERAVVTGGEPGVWYTWRNRSRRIRMWRAPD